MNAELLIFKATLAENKNKLQNLKLKATGAQSLIRQLLAPYGDLLKVDEEKLTVYTNELCEYLKEMKRLQSQITEMESDLNG